MLLVIDNYDSFTYNLVQYLGELGEDVRVYRNDKITLQQIEELRPDRIVISPGPCTPNEAGVSVETIRHFLAKEPPERTGWLASLRERGRTTGSVAREASPVERLLAPLSLVSFGGGPAIYATLQHEVVDLHQWLTPSQFLDLFAIARAAPGPGIIERPTLEHREVRRMTGPLERRRREHRVDAGVPGGEG